MAECEQEGVFEQMSVTQYLTCPFHRTLFLRVEFDRKVREDMDWPKLTGWKVLGQLVMAESLIFALLVQTTLLRDKSIWISAGAPGCHSGV